MIWSFERNGFKNRDYQSTSLNIKKHSNLTEVTQDKQMKNKFIKKKKTKKVEMKEIDAYSHTLIFGTI